MKKLNISKYTEEEQEMILGYLNYLSSKEIDKLTEDDPDFKMGEELETPELGYNIGKAVAERIIEVRDNLFEGEFTALEDLNYVYGLGNDKLHDILYSAENAYPAIPSEYINGGNYVDVIVGGNPMRQRLIQEINNAQYYINLNVMLFFNDSSGNEIAKALIDAAERGITVRVMADKYAIWIARTNSEISSEQAKFNVIRKLLADNGVSVVDTSKDSYWDFDWKTKRKELKNDGVPEEFLVIQDNVQHVLSKVEFDNAIVANHRKFLVIDGVTSIIGSFNIGDQYLQNNRWHDGFFVIRGPFACKLNKLFASQWMVLKGGNVFDYKKHYRTQSNYGDDRCYLLSSYPGKPTNPIYSFIIKTIKNHGGELIIENPYINDDGIFKALASSKTNTEGITLIAPYSSKKNDYPTGTAIRCKIYKAFIKGLKFYDYRNIMSHYKIMVDTNNDIVLHGSYNLNIRSRWMDFESNVKIKSNHVADSVKDVLTTDISESTQITDKKEFYKYPNTPLHPDCLIWNVLDFASERIVP